MIRGIAPSDFHRLMQFLPQDRDALEQLVGVALYDSSLAIEDPAGALIGATGLAKKWRGVAVGWTFRTPAMRARDWAELARPAIDALERAHEDGYRRIELVVAGDHAQGVRWAARLGFEIEAYAPAYLPDGRDAFLYARLAKCFAIAEERAA